MKVLIFIDYYMPAFKAGGPVLSIANLVAQLGEDIEIDIVTRDRDKGDDRAFSNLANGGWQNVGHARVLYLPPTLLPFQRFREILRGARYDWIYLNSFFSPFSSFYPLLTLFSLSRRTNRPKNGVIIAPRGEFAPSALAIKPLKKRLYCAIGKALNFWANVRFHAASAQEANDISAALWPLTPEIKIAADLHNLIGITTSGQAQTVENTTSSFLSSSQHGNRLRTFSSPATAGAVDPKRLEGATLSANTPSVTAAPAAPPLRIVFLSRISPMKNLNLALKVLARARSQIVFSIFGPVEDIAYWQTCLDLIEALPQHVTVHVGGPVPKGDVHSTLAAHDLFFLPTRGESYGHVIAEALSAGLPVLISDQTPWRGFAERGVGMELPLEDVDGFAQFIDHMATLTVSEQDQMRAAISKEVTAIADQTETLARTHALFFDSVAPRI